MEDTAADYQAAALAAVTRADTQATPAPAETEVKAESGATGEQPQSTPPATPPTEASEKKEASASEPAKVPEAEKPPELEKGFLALAREKAALRKQQQEMKEYALKAERYESAKTPMDLLAAKGWSYKDVLAQISGESGRTAEPGRAEPRDNPVAREVAELKQMIMQERARANQLQIEATLRDVAKRNADKIPLVSAQGAERKALEYLQKYFDDTGELPGKTMDESLSIALEMVEADYEVEAKRWESVLTKWKKPATVSSVAPKEAVRLPTSDQGAAQSKTLTNSLVAPKPGDSDEPKTAEDYQRRALELLSR